MIDPKLSSPKTSAATDPDAGNDAVYAQLKRIRGQVDGVMEMYQQGRPCTQVVHQVIAVRSSLGRVARDILTCEAGKCSRESRIEDLDEVLKELFRN